MNNVDLHHGAATDVGLVRKVNEDSYLVAPPIFVVADGMGGHSGGDVASQMVVEEFQRLVEVYDPTRGAEHVADALARAQARIVDYGNVHRALQPGWHAGTTAVVAVLVDDHGVAKWLLANLGDSRIYRITGAASSRSASTTPSCRSSSTPARSPSRRPRSTRSGT